MKRRFLLAFPDISFYVSSRAVYEQPWRQDEKKKSVPKLLVTSAAGPSNLEALSQSSIEPNGQTVLTQGTVGRVYGRLSRICQPPYH